MQTFYTIKRASGKAHESVWGNQEIQVRMIIINTWQKNYSALRSATTSRPGIRRLLQVHSDLFLSCDTRDISRKGRNLNFITSNLSIDSTLLQNRVSCIHWKSILIKRLWPIISFLDENIDNSALIAQWLATLLYRPFKCVLQLLCHFHVWNLASTESSTVSVVQWEGTGAIRFVVKNLRVFQEI